MANSPPRLSICIATRNRATLIGETLDSILAQATDDVELVIVDGASTDGTETVLQQYQRRFPNVRYSRLEVNGGVDRDYSRTVELARGEYCWFMTDDDVLKPSAIQSVLSHMQEGYNLIVVNAENRSADQATLLASRRLAIDHDRIYRPAETEALFIDVGYHLTYIGSVVIQRDLWNARDKKSYWGTWFVHFGVIFQQPLPGLTLVLAEPLISGRIGNISWNARSFEIWMFRWPELVWSMPFPDQTKVKISPPTPWRNLKALFVHRGDGSYSPKMYRGWIAPRPAPAGYKLAAQFIAHLPDCVVWLLLYFYFSRTRAQARTELYHWLHVPPAQKCFGALARTQAKRLAA